MSQPIYEHFRITGFNTYCRSNLSTKELLSVTIDETNKAVFVDMEDNMTNHNHHTPVTAEEFQNVYQKAISKFNQP